MSAEGKKGEKEESEQMDFLSNMDALCGEGLILSDLVKEEDKTTTKRGGGEQEKAAADTSLTLEDVAYLLDMDGEGGLCFQQMLSKNNNNNT